MIWHDTIQQTLNYLYISCSLDRRKKPGSSPSMWRNASWRRWVAARHWWRVKESPGPGLWRSANGTTALFVPQTRSAGNTIAMSQAALHLQIFQQVSAEDWILCCNKRLSMSRKAKSCKIWIFRLYTLKPQLKSCFDILSYVSSCSKVSPWLPVLSRWAGFTIFLLWHWLWPSQ